MPPRARARDLRLARFDQRVRHGAGVDRLAGVDEVGRGCLAGPVVVAAVVLPPGCALEGVRDSKQLSSAQRERAFAAIRGEALGWAAWAVPVEEVDRRNVLHASLWGMTRVLDRLDRLGRIEPQFVLVDGHLLPPDLDLPARALVKGDGRSLSIAAASIVAKVARDRLMRAWDRHLPGYGFARHVGYPTAEHLQALERLGPSPLHRQSFAPVRRAASLRRLPGMEA